MACRSSPASSRLSNAFKLALVCVSASALNLSRPAWADDGPLLLADNVNALVQRLADQDPAKRRDAAARLAQMGAAARPALRAAAESDDLELRSQASKLLLQLPWTSDADSDSVRLVLSRYGQLDVEQRKEAAYQLINLENHQGDEAVIRLLRDEVSSDVRWQTVRLIRNQTKRSGDSPLLQQLRSMSGTERAIAAMDAPLAAAAGWAWLHGKNAADIARANVLLHRAVELEQQKPSDAADALDFAYDHLLTLASTSNDNATAASLLRERIKSAGGASDLGTLKALARLLAMNAEHPEMSAAQVEPDLIEPYRGLPEIQYALGRSKLNSGAADEGRAMIAAAFKASAGDVEARQRVAKFLCDLRWYDLAEPELLDILKIDGPNPTLYRGNAQFQLANIAAARGDDQAIADHLQAALDLIGEGNSLNIEGGSIEGVRASAAWHRLLAARKRGNREEEQKALDAVLKTTPDSPDLVIDIVTLLQERGRADEANKLFDRSYGVVKDRLAKQPDSADRMNTLAWLLARCGRQLNEALELATQATTVDPDNAAYLDTLAEVHFRLGKPAEAARVEERALALQPGDSFMTDQLQRFRAAATSRPATQPN